MCRSEFHQLAGQQQVLAVNLLKARLRVEKLGRHLTASMIARVMIWISLMRSTRSAACARLQLPVGEGTVRSAFHAALPAMEDSLKLIQDSIPPLLLKHLQKRKRGSCIAIDLHHQPCYGKLVEGVHKAKAQQGTKRFWSIASAAVVTRGERFTLAVAPVYSNKMVNVLLVLWSHLQQLNINVGGLLQILSFMLRDLWLWFSWLSKRQFKKPPPLPLYQLQDALTAQLTLKVQTPPPLLAPDEIWELLRNACVTVRFRDFRGHHSLNRNIQRNMDRWD